MLKGLLPTLGALGLLLWWLTFRPRARETVGSLGDLSEVRKEDQRDWAPWLGVAPGIIDPGFVQDAAEAQGGSPDWVSLGWPTPCGPQDDPVKFCSFYPGPKK